MPLAGICAGGDEKSSSLPRLHGEPGTGKTQLVKLMARELSCDLFEVSSANSDGGPVSSDGRLRAFRAAEYIFANRPAFILFDEIEDIFSDAGLIFGQKSTGQTAKAWINRMLEENPVPAFWLTNSLQCLDPAFIRRFDMVIELPVPPKNRRKAIIEKVADGMLLPRAIERLAECETITPAVVSRAASVIKAIKGRIDEKDAASAIELIVSSTLKAQGHRPPTHDNADQLAAAYDPCFINADIDLAEVAKGLARTGSGRLCLYGPSGTGKTAYGRWLADQVGIPLIVKRASDLISMWVGQSEKNIAEAFHEAERDGAILLIDEVDSFLADRRIAYRTWEVSLVNEMLTQMEFFSGIFVACTNLMDWIDQAALRRFDIKAKFDFLNPTQAWELLCRSCAADGRGEPSLELRSRLSRLANLTPGDFAVVARRTRFRRFGERIGSA